MVASICSNRGNRLGYLASQRAADGLKQRPTQQCSKKKPDAKISVEARKDLTECFAIEGCAMGAVVCGLVTGGRHGQ